jgi:phosphocarrier protein HPr
MRRATLTLRNEVGLHARPAALFVRLAGRFSSEITVRNLSGDGEPKNAKSILGVLAVGAEQGHEIEVAAEGVDEEEAIDRLTRLVESEFDGDHG